MIELIEIWIATGANTIIMIELIYLLKTWSVFWLGLPAQLNEELESLRAGGGYRQLQRVRAHPPDNGRAVHVFVRYFTGQQFPHAHTK